MKLRDTIWGLFLAIFGCLYSGNAMAGSGGPDPYGYIWKDSNEPGITYNWVDITTRAGAVRVTNLADDNAVGPFNMGWDFHYYWSDYSSVKIGSNGWISFSNIGNIASCFPKVPTPGGVGDNIVAPFLSDLTFISNDGSQPNPGELWYWTNQVDSFVLQWVNVPFWRNATPDWIGSNSLQLILDGNDSSITFQYKQSDAVNFPGGSGCTTYMEIGIENVTGDLGLNYSTGATLPPSNYAVKYIYPSGVSFLVPDATPVWNVDADNAGQFVYSHRPFLLSTSLSNVGNTAITSTITAAGRVRDLGLNTAWADSALQTGLVPGNNATLFFQDTMRLTTPGQYYFEVSTSTAGGQDINPTNNTNAIEIVSVDNNGGQATLSFASDFGPTTSVSWAGGNPTDGVAVKMVPPEFPAMIDSVHVYLIGDGNLQTPSPVGFVIKIYGLDANGQPDPNNQLASTTIAAAQVIEDAWNVVPINPSVSVASGGFAVAWLQQGTGLSLGAEEFGPISRRSYEILGGSWAPYRNLETVDFLMKVSTGLPVGVTKPTDRGQDFTIFPNPIQARATVRYTLAIGGDLDFSLVDMHGRIVWQSHVDHAKAGMGEMELEVNALPAGIYGLQLRHRGIVSTRKIILLGEY